MERYEKYLLKTKQKAKYKREVKTGYMTVYTSNTKDYRFKPIK